METGPLRDLPPPPTPSALYLRPLALLAGDAARQAVAAEQALPLAGRDRAFCWMEVAVRAAAGGVVRRAAPLATVMEWAAAQPVPVGQRVKLLLAALAQPQKRWAGLDLGRPLLMGVVNVTPDSFSDGGDHADAAAAIAHGRALLQAGADILDIGGESTRPGADPVSPAEEQARILPVVAALAAAGAVVSVDTRHAATMAAALDAGARIVNDVTALAGDPASLSLVAHRGCPVVLMHMQGRPQTMQQDPAYGDVALDVYDFLAERVEACEAAGIPRDLIALDYGIGFGKTVAHNVDLLHQTGLFQALGCPLLVGVSRKRFIGALSRQEAPRDRLPGSLAAGLAALGQGAQILRVHDVAETAQARAVWTAIDINAGRNAQA